MVIRIFGKTPDAVIGKSARSCLKTLPSAVFILGKSTIEGTEIHRTISHGYAADDNIRSQTGFSLSESPTLSGKRTVADNTAIIGSAPEITIQILRNSTDITKWNGSEFLSSRRIISHAVLVATYPDSPLIVHINLLQGIVNDTSLCLGMNILATDLALEINKEETVMVGSNPEIASLITGNIAHQNAGWARNSNAHVLKIRAGIGPFSGLRLIHVIGITYRNPETTYTIIESIGTIITGSFMGSKEGIVPESLLFLAVDTAERTITIGNERIAVNLGYLTDVSLFQTTLLSLFGKFKKVSILCLSIMIVESLSVDSNPHVLILIYQKLERRPLHMDAFEPFFRFAVKLLCIVFVDAVAHRGMHPDISIIVLLKFIYRVVWQRLIISIAVIESFHTEAVKTAQSRLGTEPDVASGVLEDGTHLTVS